MTDMFVTSENSQNYRHSDPALLKPEHLYYNQPPLYITTAYNKPSSIIWRNNPPIISRFNYPFFVFVSDLFLCFILYMYNRPNKRKEIFWLHKQSYIWLQLGKNNPKQICKKIRETDWLEKISKFRWFIDCKTKMHFLSYWYGILILLLPRY